MANLTAVDAISAKKSFWVVFGTVWPIWAVFVVREPLFDLETRSRALKTLLIFISQK